MQECKFIKTKDKYISKQLLSQGFVSIPSTNKGEFIFINDISLTLPQNFNYSQITYTNVLCI